MKDMNVKIQNSGINGSGGKNSGSCADLASYLEHEDTDRLDEGKDILEFFTAEGCEVTKEEVISKIDRNHAKLGKDESKFYHIVVAPSESEVIAMGNTEAERVENAKRLAKQISEAYVENFGHEHVRRPGDVTIFWKIHVSRGENGENQLHLHAIVARKDKSNKYSLSPMTNHRKGTDGVIKTGFDRNEFAETCETIFDAVIGYDRSVEETFAYRNAMCHGSAEEKQHQADLLAEEKLKGIKEKIGAKIRSKAEEEVETLEDKTIADELDLDKGFELLEIKDAIKRALQSTESIDDFTKSLMEQGIFVRPELDDNGHVVDVVFTNKGNKYQMTMLFANGAVKAIQRFCVIAGLKPHVCTSKTLSRAIKSTAYKIKH